MTTSRAPFVFSLLLILLAGPRAAGAAGGLAIAGEGAETLTAVFNAWNAELKAESASDANRARLWESLEKSLDQARPIKEESRAASQTLAERLEQMKRERGGEALCE